MRETGWAVGDTLYERERDSRKEEQNGDLYLQKFRDVLYTDYKTNFEINISYYPDKLIFFSMYGALWGVLGHV